MISPMEELDLDKLPRRMPYTVPEGTFDAIEKAVLASIAEEKEARGVPARAVPARSVRMRRVLPWLGGVVAMVAVVLWAIISFAPLSEVASPASPSAEGISLAFEKLSPSDQEFILSVYQDELYISF